jgi:hypothetical protein
MQLRIFHLRFFQLNTGLVALIVVLGVQVEVAGSAVWHSMATVPFTGLAAYLFSMWQFRSGSEAPEDPEQDIDATKISSLMVTSTLSLPLALGLCCAATMAFAPEYTAKTAWVIPTLGFNLGHSAEALVRLSRKG